MTNHSPSNDATGHFRPHLKTWRWEPRLMRKSITGNRDRRDMTPYCWSCWSWACTYIQYVTPTEALKGHGGKNNGAPYIIYIIIIYTIIMKSCYFIFSEQLSPKLPYINPKMRQKKSKIMLHFKDGLYFTPC